LVEPRSKIFCHDSNVPWQQPGVQQEKRRKERLLNPHHFGETLLRLTGAGESDMDVQKFGVDPVETGA
jgi:hypothetical protein